MSPVSFALLVLIALAVTVWAVKAARRRAWRREFDAHVARREAWDRLPANGPPGPITGVDITLIEHLVERWLADRRAGLPADDPELLERWEESARVGAIVGGREYGERHAAFYWLAEDAGYDEALATELNEELYTHAQNYAMHWFQEQS